MEWRIAIPSYKRAETIRKKTLKYLLEDCLISKEKIDVFVADEEELKDYSYLKDEGIRVIVGLPTLKAQRNFITSYYDSGKFILNMDDDIEGIYQKMDDKSYVLLKRLDKLIELGFNNCIKHKTKLWGINAVLNPFFMKENVSTNLKYIVGCFWGQIIDKNPDLSITLEDKEDYERTIKYFDTFGKLVRLNWIAPKTNYYGESGGMQETRTEKRVTDSAVYLATKYPQYCSMNPNKIDHSEIKLNNRA
jgi:hypothetical protein